MENVSQELYRIREVLKEYPRGLSVLEISRLVKLNRHSVAKYLDILAVSGHVEMKPAGPSKIYYTSQRVPISVMLDFSSDLIIVLDARLRIIKVNDRFLAFAGHTTESVIGQTLEKVCPPARFDPQLQPLIRDALGGKEIGSEMTVETGDKTQFFNTRLIPAVFDDGSRGVTLIMEDITAKKSAEITLRSTNEMLEKKVQERTAELEKARNTLKAVLDTAPGPLVVIDAETGRFTYVSPSFEDILGSPRVGDDIDTMAASLEILKQDGTPFQIDELPIKRAVELGEVLKNVEITVRKDNELLHLITSFAPIRDKDGKIVSAVSSIMDITALKLTQKRHHDTSELMQAIIRASPLPIIALDLDCKVLLWNPAAEEMFGWKKEEVLGTMLPTVADLKDRYGQKIKAIVANGEYYQGMQIPRKRKDGTIVNLRIYISPIHDETGKIIGSLGVMQKTEPDAQKPAIQGFFAGKPQ